MLWAVCKEVDCWYHLPHWAQWVIPDLLPAQMKRVSGFFCFFFFFSSKIQAPKRRRYIFLYMVQIRKGSRQPFSQCPSLVKQCWEQAKHRPPDSACRCCGVNAPDPSYKSDTLWSLPGSKGYLMVTFQTISCNGSANSNVLLQLLQLVITWHSPAIPSQRLCRWVRLRGICAQQLKRMLSSHLGIPFFSAMAGTDDKIAFVFK